MIFDILDKREILRNLEREDEERAIKVNFPKVQLSADTARSDMGTVSK